MTETYYKLYENNAPPAWICEFYNNSKYGKVGHFFFKQLNFGLLKKHFYIIYISIDSKAYTVLKTLFPYPLETPANCMFLQ